MTRKFVAIGAASDSEKARARAGRSRREAAADDDAANAAAAEVQAQMRAHFAGWSKDPRNAERFKFAATNMRGGSAGRSGFDDVLDEALGLKRPRSTIVSLPVYRD